MKCWCHPMCISLTIASCFVDRVISYMCPCGCRFAAQRVTPSRKYPNVLPCGHIVVTKSCTCTNCASLKGYLIRGVPIIVHTALIDAYTPAVLHVACLDANLVMQCHSFITMKGLVHCRYSKFCQATV